ncbi:MAG: ATP-binding cassette domain-containing protein [Coriobacteriales bacterium]|jgi:peptide/nickel transport system ATP-binding protein|nr:ATP-binding cassette domain-containing protein [Coriobacteriales bacterium]
MPEQHQQQRPPQLTPLHHPDHVDGQFHHGHDHAPVSHHAGGHHLLQVEQLSINFIMYDPDDRRYFRARKRPFAIIDQLSLSLHAGEVLGLVGASGSGKTLLANALLGLFEPNAQVSGRIWFDGQLQDARSLARLRGRQIALVPQSLEHLDPLMPVLPQICGPDNRPERREKARQLLARYGLPAEVARSYPHELSGGMARRVLLACALIDEPQVIIADEPTPGLDLELAQLALSDFRALANAGAGVLLITHDIELALSVADRIAVFRDGTVVEETAVANFASPDTLRHEFSRALWHALPEHDFDSGDDSGDDSGEPRP